MQEKKLEGENKESVKERKKHKRRKKNNKGIEGRTAGRNERCHTKEKWMKQIVE
jgi:hypothetical protein